MKRFLLLFVTLALCAGCASTNVYNVEHPIGFEIKPTDVRKAILRAGLTRGWQMKQVRDGLIEATYIKGEKMVKVSIPYSASDYSINYKDSANMNSNPAKGTISSTYNRWVKTLEFDISKQLAGVIE